MRPNTGHAAQPYSQHDLKTYAKITNQAEAKRIWEGQYKKYGKYCGHTDMSTCPGETCTFKKREHMYNLLTGSVLRYWGEINSSMDTLKVIRVPLRDGSRLVGLHIPDDKLQRVLDATKSCEKAKAPAQLDLPQIQDNLLAGAKALRNPQQQQGQSGSDAEDDCDGERLGGKDAGRGREESDRRVGGEQGADAGSDSDDDDDDDDDDKGSRSRRGSVEKEGEEGYERNGVERSDSKRGYSSHFNRVGPTYISRIRGDGASDDSVQVHKKHAPHRRGRVSLPGDSFRHDSDNSDDDVNMLSGESYAGSAVAMPVRGSGSSRRHADENLAALEQSGLWEYDEEVERFFDDGQNDAKNMDQSNDGGDDTESEPEDPGAVPDGPMGREPDRPSGSAGERDQADDEGYGDYDMADADIQDQDAMTSENSDYCEYDMDYDQDATMYEDAKYECAICKQGDGEGLSVCWGCSERFHLSCDGAGHGDECAQVSNGEEGSETKKWRCKQCSVDVTACAYDEHGAGHPDFANQGGEHFGEQPSDGDDQQGSGAVSGEQGVDAVMRDAESVSSEVGKPGLVAGEDLGSSTGTGLDEDAHLEHEAQEHTAELDDSKNAPAASQQCEPVSGDDGNDDDDSGGAPGAAAVGEPVFCTDETAGSEGPRSALGATLDEAKRSMQEDQLSWEGSFEECHDELDDDDSNDMDGEDSKEDEVGIKAEEDEAGGALVHARGGMTDAGGMSHMNTEKAYQAFEDVSELLNAGELTREQYDKEIAVSSAKPCIDVYVFYVCLAVCNIPVYIQRNALFFFLG